MLQTFTLPAVGKCSIDALIAIAARDCLMMQWHGPKLISQFTVQITKHNKKVAPNSERNASIPSASSSISNSGPPNGIKLNFSEMQKQKGNDINPPDIWPAILITASACEILFKVHMLHVTAGFTWGPPQMQSAAISGSVVCCGHARCWARHECAITVQVMATVHALMCRQ